MARTGFPALTRSVDVLTPTTDIHADPMATITVHSADYQYDEYVDRTQSKTGFPQVRFDTTRRPMVH